MPTMRIRQPPASKIKTIRCIQVIYPTTSDPRVVAFGVLVLASAYLGLAPSTIPSYGQSDKLLHFLIFFLLTVRLIHTSQTTTQTDKPALILLDPRNRSPSEPPHNLLRLHPGPRCRFRDSPRFTSSMSPTPCPLPATSADSTPSPRTVASSIP